MDDLEPGATIRILHLEDEPNDVLLIRTALEADGVCCTVEHVKTRAEFVAALERGDFDLVLSDFALPGFDGLAALEHSRELATEVPFVFVTGTIGEEAAIAAVRNGATDYVLKHRLSRLAPAVRRAIHEARERQTRLAMEQALRDSEERFRQAQKMEAVGRLAAGVAHDFNNMLTAIMGYAQLAKLKLGPAHRAESDLDEVRKAGERAAGLTRQLLAFSRQQVLQPRTLNLNDLILDLGKMLHRLIGSDIDLLTLPGKSVGPILADPGQIQQVLLNLVVNARDAMPRGGRLTIETSEVLLDERYVDGKPDLQPGPFVMLAVSDDGIGIDAELKSRIFEPFFTTKEIGKGTGLGLSTVFGIVRQSGGSIEVYSEPGQGATFKVYFPRSDAKTESIIAAPSNATELTGSEIVLLVEDDDAVRGVAQQTLALHGYEVREAMDGNEALRILESSRDDFDLMITDIIMPGIGGSELMARAASLRPEMKFLCISGYAEGAVLHQAVIVERTPFLQKPFTPEALLRKVREVIGSDHRMAA